MRKYYSGLVFGTAALVALASSGKADGFGTGSVKDAPVPMAYEWNGVSVGLGIGVGQINQDIDAKAWRKDEVEKNKCYVYGGCTPKYDFSKYKSLSTELSDDDWNVFGTAQIGYDRLIHDRFLIGAFADFDFYNDADLTFSEKKGHNTLSGTVERDNMWTIGGRIGFLATPRVLLYGLAGYSQMKLDGDLNATFKDPFHQGNNTNLGLTVDENVGGYTVGGGIEAKLEKRVSLKLEYRYSHFDGASAKVSGLREGDWSTTPYCGKYYLYDRTISEGGKLDLGETDLHSVRAVLSFKLGRDEVAPAPLK